MINILTLNFLLRNFPIPMMAWIFCWEVVVEHNCTGSSGAEGLTVPDNTRATRSLFLSSLKLFDVNCTWCDGGLKSLGLGACLSHHVQNSCDLQREYEFVSKVVLKLDMADEVASLSTRLDLDVKWHILVPWIGLGSPRPDSDKIIANCFLTIDTASHN